MPDGLLSESEQRLIVECVAAALDTERGDAETGVVHRWQRRTVIPPLAPIWLACDGLRLLCCRPPLAGVTVGNNARLFHPSVKAAPDRGCYSRPALIQQSVCSTGLLNIGSSFRFRYPARTNERPRLE